MRPHRYVEECRSPEYTETFLRTNSVHRRRTLQSLTEYLPWDVEIYRCQEQPDDENHM